MNNNEFYGYAIIGIDSIYSMGRTKEDAITNFYIDYDEGSIDLVSLNSLFSRGSGYALLKCTKDLYRIALQLGIPGASLLYEIYDDSFIGVM